jgi:hypothetical protein
MNTKFLVLLAVVFGISAALRAGPRTSTNYNITTETTDAGGKRSTSTNYTSDGSAGGVAGISTVAAPAETAKHGYIGQLTEVSSLQIAASLTTVNESATRQLSATQLLDDLTTNTIPAASVTWSIVSGPLTGISTGGLATAATVFQNTAATAQGIYAGNIGTLGLTVLDSISDNFGSYAGDGIGDDWQFQFFGLNNPNAAPLLDPDGDGHNNRFEFTAGIIPTAAASKFDWRIDPVPGFPNQKKLIFSPLVAGRTYTIKTATTLGVPMTMLSPLPGDITDNGNERTVTDTSATGSTKFYSVEILKQ